MSADKLYTPELLAAAVELARVPPLPHAPLHGEARSQACGSTLAIDVVPGDGDRITAVGMLVRACAVGQGAAAVFARHAIGRSKEDITAAHDALVSWLSGQGPMPEWPDLELIAPARDFPGRHGAMLLPWKAALAALSSAPATR